MDKLNALAEKYPTRGFDEYYGRIRNEGLVWNRKRRLPARIKEPYKSLGGISPKKYVVLMNRNQNLKSKESTLGESVKDI